TVDTFGSSREADVSDYPQVTREHRLSALQLLHPRPECVAFGLDAIDTPIRSINAVFAVGHRMLTHRLAPSVRLLPCKVDNPTRILRERAGILRPSSDRRVRLLFHSSPRPPCCAK